jgi:ADP-heptose:LPS heptosyltransferase
MSKAQMNYVNDSGPMHLASATNAPTTAIYCSTIPSFGFGPLSSRSIAVELEEKLDCKPCGIHGHAACPKQHFKCGNLLTAEKVFSALK